MEITNVTKLPNKDGYVYSIHLEPSSFLELLFKKKSIDVMVRACSFGYCFIDENTIINGIITTGINVDEKVKFPVRQWWYDNFYKADTPW